MKVLITGANGQLGKDLVKVFEKDSEVIAADRKKLDITNKDQVEKVISQEKPDFIIHAAAWTNVDEAAKFPDKALEVNGFGSKNVAEAAKKVKAKMVYISTNEVFDGTKKNPYLEDDKPNPVNPYGVSKLAGENFCREVLDGDCIVVRTSWLYGPGSEVNFPNKILKKAKEQGFLKVVDDEVATPTYTPDLAKAIRELVEKPVSGIFHLVNEGYASRYDWAKEIVGDKNLEVDVEKMKLKDFERASKVPPKSILENKKAKELGVVLRSWQEACKSYLSLI